MRQQRDKPLSQILQELQKFPPNSLVDAIDGGTIVLINPERVEVGTVECFEYYDDGVADPTVPTF